MTAYTKRPEAVAALTPEQYQITQQCGTERPGTGALLHEKRAGLYVDVVSGEPLFASTDKYDSGSGWPSFYQPLAADAVATAEDNTHGMHRVEVRCPHCGAHLGHVFPDGPQPTGLRYCINSASLDLDKKD